MKIVLDHAGMTQVLTSAAVSDVILSTALRVASNAEAAYPEPHSDGPVNVEVDEYVASGGRLLGERAAASVIATHPAALGYEAKHGTLTRAAAAAGLEVKEGGDGLVDYVTKAGKKKRVSAKQAAAWNRQRGLS